MEGDLKEKSETKDHGLFVKSKYLIYKTKT